MICGQSFTLHPNGVVADYTISCYYSSGSNKSTRSYDERGVLKQTRLEGTGRFGPTSVTTSIYNYVGGRLNSIDATLSPASASYPPAHTEYLYDYDGNNVERVTTGGAANQHYLGTYDTAGNLVCESDTAPLPLIRHFDYGCFD